MQDGFIASNSSGVRVTVGQEDRPCNASLSENSTGFTSPHYRRHQVPRGVPRGKGLKTLFRSPHVGLLTAGHHFGDVCLARLRALSMIGKCVSPRKRRIAIMDFPMVD